MRSNSSWYTGILLCPDWSIREAISSSDVSIFALVISTLGIMISLATVLSSWKTPRIILTSCSSRGSPWSSKCIAILSVPSEVMLSSSDWDEPISIILSWDLVRGLSSTPMKVAKPNTWMATVGPMCLAIVLINVSTTAITIRHMLVINRALLHSIGLFFEKWMLAEIRQVASVIVLSIEKADPDWSAFLNKSSNFSLPFLDSLLHI